MLEQLLKQSIELPVGTLVTGECVVHRFNKEKEIFNLTTVYLFAWLIVSVFDV